MNIFRLFRAAIALVGLAGCGATAVGTGDLNPAPPATAVPSPVAAATATPAGDDLAALSDEFVSSASLAEWQDLARVEGWPDWIEQADVDTTSPGQLYLAPAASGWYEDYRGVYLFKEVDGDFDVRTRILATGKTTEVPTRTFSLSGLMVRAPRDITMETWQPNGENWLFITTGYGDEDPRRIGKPQIETKTTKNSSSRLELIVVKPGWVELRVVRLGPTFAMLYRGEGDPWQVSKVYYRPDLPERLQVGLNAYSSWGVDRGGGPEVFNRTPLHGPGDLIVRSEYVRFSRPPVSAEFRAEAADGTISHNALLAALGE